MTVTLSKAYQFLVDSYNQEPRSSFYDYVATSLSPVNLPIRCFGHASVANSDRISPHENP